MFPFCLAPEKQHPDVMLRLQARRPAYPELNDTEFNAIQKAFESIHCWVNAKEIPFEAVFLFYDNSVVPEPIETHKLRFEISSKHTRNKQMYSIATSGIPILIGRKAFARWGRNKLTAEEQEYKAFFGSKWFFNFDHTKKDYSKD